jgi:hypothetical protein
MCVEDPWNQFIIFPEGTTTNREVKPIFPFMFSKNSNITGFSKKKKEKKSVGTFVKVKTIKT